MKRKPTPAISEGKAAATRKISQSVSPSRVGLFWSARTPAIAPSRIVQRFRAFVRWRNTTLARSTPLTEIARRPPTRAGQPGANRLVPGEVRTVVDMGGHHRPPWRPAQRPRATDSVEAARACGRLTAAPRYPVAVNPASRNDRFLRACRLEPVDRTPVWFMRQAGRYLPEYRALREGRDVLALCRSPELAVEATLQPLRRMPLDAAILFSDIMVPVAEMGADVRIEPGAGPFRREPVRAP